MVAQGRITVDMVAGKIKEQDTLAKEKKPRRQKDKDISEEQVIWVDNASLKTRKNNKKKKKADTKEDSSPNRETKTMKKKKKQLEGKGSVSVLEPPLSQEEPSGKKHKKPKKTSVSVLEPPLTQEEPSGKKHKKPKKTNDESVQSEAAGGLRADKDVTTLAKKKTTGKKRGAKSPVTKTIATEEESQGVHHEAKKRKAPLEVVDDETVEKKAKKGKKDKTKQTKAKKAPSSVVVVDEESPKPKKKKKQAKQGEKEVAAMVEVTQEGSVVDDKGPKRKKHKNGSGQTVMDTAQNTEAFVFVASDSKGKGKRGMKAPEEIQIKAQQEEVEVSVDKKKKKKCKKIKLEKDAPGTEPTPEGCGVVFLSEKTGNRDEVTINQERRMALQMDIDKESHPKAKAKSLAAQGFGQWSTAQFDSTDKQQKFLRLMGGFKAAKTSSSPGGPGAERPNMALAQDKQKDLQQALLGEFERAQSRRVDFSARGAGLGFSAPPPSKKFSIDVNASRSVRFDD